VELPHLAWAEGERVSLPGDLLEVTRLSRLVTAGGTLDIPQSVVVPGGAAASIRDRAAFTDTPPASSRLPVSYQLVPGWARALIANALGRWQRRSVRRWAAFPGFPLDLSADFIADLERGGVAART